MGTSSSGAELVGKLFHAADILPNAKRVGLERAAQLIKRTTSASMPSRLRGVGKKGARIGVRYDIAGDTAVVKATGPEHLIERDTKAHEIMPKAKKALALADGQVRSVVEHHPGTKGKHPFEKGVDAAAPLVPELFLVETGKALRSVF